LRRITVLVFAVVWMSSYFSFSKYVYYVPKNLALKITSIDLKPYPPSLHVYVETVVSYTGIFVAYRFGLCDLDQWFSNFVGQQPGKFFSVRRGPGPNKCQGPVPDRDPAVKKHCSKL
jgi:hypothetical protein